jgi:hypothetical protein
MLVGAAEVGIEDHTLFSPLRQGYGDIGRDHGLANSSLATGDGPKTGLPARQNRLL